MIEAVHDAWALKHVVPIPDHSLSQPSPVSRSETIRIPQGRNGTINRASPVRLALRYVTPLW